MDLEKKKKIIDYVKFLKKKMNFRGNIILDKSKPDGTPRKILDSSIATKYGWRPKINLSDGFNITFNDFMSKIEKNLIK